MNTERYILPIVIAAGLHGALVLSFMDSVVVYPPEKTKKEPTERPPIVDRIEIIPENSSADTSPEPTGGPVPPPRIPDFHRDLPKDDIFTVRVTGPVETLRPILARVKIPEGVGEPGDGKGLSEGLPGVANYFNLDRAPKVIAQPSPTYPDAMRKSGTEGAVTVEFVVDTTGRVVSAEATHWTHREFVEPATRAVLRWRFEPGTINARKVNFRMAVPIVFNSSI